MKLKYIYTLLTLIIALYFVPAQAQTKKPVKKATTKTAAKKAPANRQLKNLRQKLLPLKKPAHHQKT